MTKWKSVERPGFFGRKKGEKIAELNRKYGEGDWRLVWQIADDEIDPGREFAEACKDYYEESYYRWFMVRPEELDFICSFGECIDNAPTNVQSGLDYTKQEAFSTHIQDIAVRNVLARMGRKFEGPPDKILVIRTKDSAGFRFGPGNIPFYEPELIAQPSKCPQWANIGSVEDFWQSNKYVQIRVTE